MSGKVVRDPFVYPNGTKSFLLQSHSESGYIIIQVHTTANKNIAAGQHLYVSGDLHSEQFENVNGKPRHQYIVNATDVSFISKSYLDINSVELRASVASGIFKTTDSSQFRVQTSCIDE